MTLISKICLLIDSCYLFIYKLLLSKLVMRSERVAVGLLVVSVCEWVNGRSFSEEGKGGIRERQSRKRGRGEMREKRL